MSRRAHPASRRWALLLLLGAVLTACTAGQHDEEATSTAQSALPHRWPTIPGVTASEVLEQAKAALPGSTQSDSDGDDGHVGFRHITETSIGYPDQPGNTEFGSTPGISISWEDDGTLIYVSCDDMTSAGFSAVMAVCTDLPVPGVPVGGLKSVWDEFAAGSWDQAQPFPQISVGAFDYPTQAPARGPARNFSISGPDAGGATVTNTTSL